MSCVDDAVEISELITKFSIGVILVTWFKKKLIEGIAVLDEIHYKPVNSWVSNVVVSKTSHNYYVTLDI